MGVGLGELEALPSFPVPPRAAITSSRNELLLKREMILSAVSGLLEICQYLVKRQRKLNLITSCYLVSVHDSISEGSDSPTGLRDNADCPVS
jgi:hypothetical protein